MKEALLGKVDGKVLATSEKTKKILQEVTGRNPDTRERASMARALQTAPLGRTTVTTRTGITQDPARLLASCLRVAAGEFTTLL